jgi:ribose-phosphate pyrophosphokinase
MRILSGTSNLPLVNSICEILNIKPVERSIKRFADHEIFVDIHESVRGEDIFLIQSTSPPVNDHLMELMLICDALKRNSVRSITAIIPYFGYARQDRKTTIRTSISAKLVANLLVTSGISRIITVDLHSAQMEGFFDINIDNISISPLFIEDILNKNFSNPIIVSPDIGGVMRARNLAQKINLDVAIIDKRRSEAGKSEVMNVIGNVQGKNCILIDDIVDSGGTLIGASKALLENGATDVCAYITHGVLSNDFLETPFLKNIIITDSINPKISHHKLQILSLNKILANTINYNNRKSIGGVFNNEKL